MIDIEFKGELSKENKEQVVEMSDIFKNGLGIMMALLLSAFIMVLAIFVHPICWCMLIFNTPFIVMLVFVHDKDAIKANTPLRIAFNIEDYTVEFESEKYHETVSISEVTVVVDNGSAYWLSLDCMPAGFYVCQKDLITTGTIEQFEEIFADKIVVSDLKSARWRPRQRRHEEDD